jgi:hypothetical protein
MAKNAADAAVAVPMFTHTAGMRRRAKEAAARQQADQKRAK